MGTRLLVLAILSMGLIYLDSQTSFANSSRSVTSYILSPVYWLANQPGNFVRAIDSYMTSRKTLIEENERLHSEARILQGKVQKLVSLTAENVRLRELLSSSTTLEDSVLVAELINVAPDPGNHQVIINRGADDGVYVGQSVIDAYGLVGQVIEVNMGTARVMLISDARHATPVQVNRNGVRAVAEGTGKIDTLILPNMVATTDIKAGDLLVSSGLGQRFPVGYPVGVVESVVHDPGRPFLELIVRPSAQLDRSRHLLLVFAGGIPE